MPASAPGSPGTCLPGPPRHGMPAARHPAAPRAAATPPEVAAANTISRSRSPNRNIAATEPRAHIGQASDFSPI